MLNRWQVRLKGNCIFFKKTLFVLLQKIEKTLISKWNYPVRKPLRKEEHLSKLEEQNCSV